MIRTNIYNLIIDIWYKVIPTDISRFYVLAEINEKEKKKEEAKNKICIYVFHTIRRWVLIDIRFETISRERYIYIEGDERGQKI